MLIAIYFIFFLFTAIEWGRFEKFIFGDCKLHVGKPDLWGYFKAGYHVPMASIVLAIAMFMDFTYYLLMRDFFGFVFYIPLWALTEDLTYWIRNPFDRLEATDWISAGLGGYIIFGQFVPNTYWLMTLWILIISFIKLY